MKELVVISGKGGTGKTSLVAAFACLSKNKVLCDADVDASDLHLILSPEIKKREEFKAGNVAIINKDKCTQCGLCKELCRWNAIKENFVIDPIDCEGCGVCYYFCPEGAIDFPEKVCGEWFISETRFGPMVHARLGIAEENSGKLVSLVRQEAKKIAEQKNFDFIITDGPPGIGCPVISSIGGASGILIVSEPTISGIHDMNRVADLAFHFNIPALLCINKFDLNIEQTKELESLAQSKNIPVIGHIPFDPSFTKAMVLGKTVVEFIPDSKLVAIIKDIWKKLRTFLSI